MKVDRVVFRGLKALQNRDDSFLDLMSDGPAPSVCLRGVNGSGKTTYLEAIASIWALFRACSQYGHDVEIGQNNLLRHAGLVAVRFVGLPGRESELWIVCGDQSEWESIPGRGDAKVVGVLRSGGSSTWRNVLDRNEPIYRYWDDNATKLEQAGERSSAVPLPNMVMIGAEDRYIRPLKDKKLFQLESEAWFQFLARYEASDKKKGHIENALAALLTVSPDRFAEVSKKLHQALPRIELLNRGHRQTRRPLVKLSSGAEVTLDQLSAGERAAVIALFMIVRWLARGGVVLVDEPELHQHLSLMRANLAILEHYVVKEMGGQLIVASHAPEIWDHFRIRRPIIDLDLASEIANS